VLADVVGVKDNTIFCSKSIHKDEKLVFKSHRVHMYLDTLIFFDKTDQRVGIPIKNITTVEVYDVDMGSSIMFTLGGLACAVGVVFLFALLTKDSCPFIYAYNGEHYEFTGEIYSGAIHPPLERHDYLKLPSIQPLEDEYLIRMTNEVKEIQHTNVTDLLIVDHPERSNVLVDKYGRIHSLQKLTAPHEARTSDAVSVLDELIACDSLSYIGDRPVGLKDDMDAVELVFKKKTDSNIAKLVIHAKNTFWLDYLFGQFHELFGDRYEQWKDKQKQASPEKMRAWSLDQGVPLAVYLYKDGKWEFQDYYNVMGPMAYREDILCLDISEIETDEIRVKLEFGFLFWDIDYLALDFSENLAVQEKIVPLSGATDQNGNSVMDLLAQDDKAYYIQKKIGDNATLSFKAPAREQGKARTVFLHSKGHYEVLRNPSGEPDVRYLQAFHKPGRFIEFSRERYLNLMGW
jgi:hypothetical protein